MTIPPIRTRPRRRIGVALAFIPLVTILSACQTYTYGPSGTQSSSGPMEQVVLVGNAVAGTVSFLNGTTFQNLGSVNVIPDLTQRMSVINSNPITAIGYAVAEQQETLAKFEPDNGVRYVDDVALSPNGETLYVSRATSTT